MNKLAALSVLLGLSNSLLYSQIAPTNPIPTEVLTGRPNPAVREIPTIASDFYIIGEMFWAAVRGGGKVLSVECVLNDPTFRWRSIRNNDGTVTITSHADNNLKLVYKEIRLPDHIRIPGDVRDEIGHFAESAQSASFPGSSSRYITKWKLQNINGQQY